MKPGPKYALSKWPSLGWIAVAYGISLTAAFLVVASFPSLYPFWVVGFADLAATGVIFLFSVILDNSSVYDPYWSVAPIPITFFWLLAGQEKGADSIRQMLVFLWVSLWGMRLTLNWIHRWKGLADEDFRYLKIRERTQKAYWPASFASIHLLPTLWVFLGLLPLYPALALPGRPFNWIDGLASLVVITAIGIEAVADYQLMRFLQGRSNGSETLSTGLWSLCRHPNYFGEVLFWWGLLGFGLAAGLEWWWTSIGALLITLLFAFISAPWMDRRMLAHHPSYAHLMRSMPMLIPGLLGKRFLGKRRAGSVG